MLKKGDRLATLLHIVTSIEKHAHDSEVGFAARVLGLIQLIRKARETGDVDEVGKQCLRLGYLTQQAGLKPLADHALVVKAAGKNNFRSHNADEKTHALKRWKPAREEAKAIRARHPDWSEMAVAAQVRKNLKLDKNPELKKANVQVIARRIKV